MNEWLALLSNPQLKSTIAGPEGGHATINQNALNKNSVLNVFASLRLYIIQYMNKYINFAF